MKSLLIGGSIALVLMVPACKKPEGGASASASSAPAPEAVVATSAKKRGGGDMAAPTEAGQGKVADRAMLEKLPVLLAPAYESYGKHDVERTLKTLDEVPEELKGEPSFLNLRGACYTEQRDFEAALADFRGAAKKKPGDPSIRFNVAEMSFVTKKWEEAIETFQVLQSQGAVKGTVSELVDFKLMLCEEGRGNAAEFDRRAAENLKEPDSLLAAYTKAAMEFRAQNAEEAKAALADAATRFPRSAELAPWQDTMIEFGYDPRK